MNNLLKYIHSLTEFSEESWELLQPALSKKQFKKNDFLLHEGQICNSLFYIDLGYCKSYYEIDGAKKTQRSSLKMTSQQTSTALVAEKNQNLTSSLANH